MHKPQLGAREPKFLLDAVLYLSYPDSQPHTFILTLQGKALYNAPVQEPHLLPFYARVAASLAQVFPDVATSLLKSLEEEFAELKVRCYTHNFTKLLLPPTL